MTRRSSAKSSPHCPKCNVNVVCLKRHDSGHHQMSCSVRYDAGGVSVRCQRDPVDRLFHCRECNFGSAYPSSLQRHVGKCRELRRKIRAPSRRGVRAGPARKRTAVARAKKQPPIHDSESDGDESEGVVSNGGSSSSASPLSCKEVLPDVDEGVPDRVEENGNSEVMRVDHPVQCEATVDYLSPQLEVGHESQDIDDLQLQYPDSEDGSSYSD